MILEDAIEEDRFAGLFVAGDAGADRLHRRGRVVPVPGDRHHPASLAVSPPVPLALAGRAGLPDRLGPAHARGPVRGGSVLSGVIVGTAIAAGVRRPLGDVGHLREDDGLIRSSPSAARECRIRRAANPLAWPRDDRVDWRDLDPAVRAGCVTIDRRGIARGASPERNRANRSEVSRAVPSPKEEVASGEVPPMLVVRRPGPPPRPRAASGAPSVRSTNDRTRRRGNGRPFRSSSPASRRGRGGSPMRPAQSSGAVRGESRPAATG